MRTPLGRKVRELREIRGWSQESLAASAHIKVSTLIDLEVGKRATRAGTLKQIADALQIDVRVLLEARDAGGVSATAAAPNDVLPGTPPVGPQTEALTEQLQELVRTSSVPLIDPARFLSRLRTRLVTLEDGGGSDKAAELVKRTIKSFCIQGEIYSTMAASEDDAERVLRFACSGAVDTSIIAYSEDTEWEQLLGVMREAARAGDKQLIRVIFVRQSRPYAPTELFTLKNIVAEHLKSHVTVALVPIENLPGELNHRKNMAVFGHHGLFSATDQVSWDLAFASSKLDVGRAVAKHEALLERAVCVLRPEDIANVSAEIDSLFHATDTSSD